MTVQEPKRKWKTVAIVGVGLIGGSIGLTLRRRKLAQRVVGVGRRTASLRRAKQLGCVDTTTTNIARGVTDAQLIIVCTPVGQIVEHVLEAAIHAHAEALITDAGSTKAEIVSAIENASDIRANFVGSHPLAGSEKNGAQFARDDLLDGRMVVLTPTRKTDKQVINMIESFWQSLGANTERMTPTAHDEALAAVSHLPHLIASALAASTPSKYLPFVAGGWQDTTRIAAGDVELWRQIFQDNKGDLLKSLDRFEQLLAKLRGAVESNDQSQLRRLLQAAKDRRDSIGN
jgi:prephenate dehydrogenase